MLKVVGNMLDKIAMARDGIFDLTFMVGTVPIHTRLTICKNARDLVIFFHGAVDRATRELPLFMGHPKDISSTAHCLSISDPSIRDRETRIAWYAGDQFCDTLLHIPELIRMVSEVLHVHRRIYAGASGGGFAALNFARSDKDGFAIVSNPQTSISSYLPVVVKRYRESAWPDLGAAESLAKVTRDCLANEYACGFSCRVIYIQSLGDNVHYFRHALPFISACASCLDRKNLYFHSDFWGKIGHHHNSADWINWIKSALGTPSSDWGELLMFRHSLKTNVEKKEVRISKMEEKSCLVFDEEHLRIKAYLTRLHKEM